MASELNLLATESDHYQQLLSGDISQGSSADPSRPTSAAGDQAPKRSRVRFNSTSEANDSTNHRSSLPLRDGRPQNAPKNVAFPKQARTSPSHSTNNSVTDLLRHSPEKEEDNPFADPSINAVHKPRPSLLRTNSTSFTERVDGMEEFNEKVFSALAAQERAQRVASLVGSHSAPASRRTSLEDLTEEDDLPHGPGGTYGYPVRVDDIPLVPMDRLGTYGELDSDEEAPEKKTRSSSEAHKLVQAHTKHRAETWRMSANSEPGLISGQITPVEEREQVGYVPRPQQYRGGVLSSLLKLYNAPPATGGSRRGSDTSLGSPAHTRESSGTTTPRTKANKWYNQKNQSHDTLAGLVQASAILGAQGGAKTPKKQGPTRLSPGKRNPAVASCSTLLGSRLVVNPDLRMKSELQYTSPKLLAGKSTS